MSIMYFLNLSDRTAFFKLQDIFPECFLNREKSPQAEPMTCLRDSCPTNHNCMETLAKRLNALFDLLKGIDLFILYFKKRNITGLGAGVFWRDMREPRVITMNQGAWNRLKLRGAIYQFQPDPSFFLSGKSQAPDVEEEAHIPKSTSLV